MPQTVDTQPVDDIIHEFYCAPQRGTTEVRTERYQLPRPGADGITIAEWVEVHRCMECGAATYDGTPERQIGEPPPMSRPRPRTD